jgi:hypothetical protein
MVSEINSELNSASVVTELTEPKKPLTLKELKKARSIYVTRRNDIVEHCGHKFHTDNQPDTNCPYCWFAFFQTFGEVTQTADEVYQKEGKEMLVKIRGKKFVKNFLQFMKTLAYMKENNINGFGNGQTLESISGGREGT